MINVVYSDDPMILDHSLFPSQNPANLIYLQQSLTNYTHNLTESGMAFMEKYRTHYASIDHADIARRARIAQRGSDLFRADTIVALESVEQLQQASVVMQRYLMAHPGYRALYNQNKADGFADTYRDVEPGAIGENHTDYRKVMSGAVVDLEDEWVAVQYLDDLHKEDAELGVDQKMLIRRSWAAMDVAISQGKDPGNPYGGDLGV